MEIEIVDTKWDSKNCDPLLNADGDDFEYVYNDDCVIALIKRAIFSSKYTQMLINCHPSKISGYLLDLETELEDEEWNIALGTINLSYEDKKINVTASSEINPDQFLDLTIEL